MNLDIPLIYLYLAISLIKYYVDFCRLIFLKNNKFDIINRRVRTNFYQRGIYIMNKQELANKIWAGANELRGKVSASDYKDYMLGFVFYKFLSNKEEKYLKEKLYFEDEDMSSLSEEDNDTVQNCKNNIGYFISYDSLFSTWIKKGIDFQIKDVEICQDQ